jgi:hypothetical protein
LRFLFLGRRIGALLCLSPIAFAAPISGSSAQAQSFFEQLFGTSQPTPPRPMPAERLGRSGLSVRGTDQGGENFYTRSDAGPRSTERDSDRPSGKGNLQSMCVRTCDGYYWPIRYPVSRQDLSTDAAICQASCGAEAKLYYRSGPGAGPDEMRDLEGRTYAESRTAFVYRKTLIDGCSCQPMPWSGSEMARHERYGLIEAERDLRLAEAQRLAEEAKRPIATASALAPPTAPASSATAYASRPSLDADTARGQAPHSVAEAGSADPLAEAGAKEVASATASEQPGLEQRSSQQHGRRAETRQIKVATANSRVTPARKAPDRAVRTASNATKPAGIFGLGGPAPRYRYPGD